MRFKYLGQPAGNWLDTLGPCFTIRVPKQDGTYTVLNASDPVNGFTVGDDIGFEFTDARSIRVMQADTRFAQL
jgi:hypothetical protein